jgi:hypothetical protein
MKLRHIVVALVLLAPAIARADQMDMGQAAHIMQFDQSVAMHMFLPDANGGVMEIVVHSMDAHQIALVRSHLLDEAAKFAKGDYADPASIHGQSLPGLSALESSASHVSVRYFETPTGAAIMLSSANPAMVSAIHAWLSAQKHDHDSDPQHCDMKM